METWRLTVVLRNSHSQKKWRPGILVLMLKNILCPANFCLHFENLLVRIIWWHGNFVTQDIHLNQGVLWHKIFISIRECCYSQSKEPEIVPVFRQLHRSGLHSKTGRYPLSSSLQNDMGTSPVLPSHTLPPSTYVYTFFMWNQRQRLLNFWFTWTLTLKLHPFPCIQYTL
jgi:hypothetical protein